MHSKQVEELICHGLGTERGGTQINETATRCAVNEELAKEWTKYLDETRNHDRLVLECMEKLGESRMGWTRELWISALGRPAALPPRRKRRA